jgi:N-acetylglutamate synthase-like GNAT family acetyltransferase
MREHLRIRPYTEPDREACLAVIRSNTPEHFVATDEDLLARFLDDLPGPYFVVEDREGTVVACGGIAEEEDASVATLCWGIVAGDRHRSGIGTTLLQHRLAAFLPAHPHVQCLRVNTTQRVQGFFERHGFRVIAVHPGGYGPGLDHVRMERRLLG